MALGAPPHTCYLQGEVSTLGVTEGVHRPLTTVAIVEAQRLFGPFFSQLLANAGFTVVSSTDTIAIEDLGRADPAVVVIDIIEGDALAALKLLRATLPNATICTFTGRIDEDWAVACWFAGANCVISKLASPPEFIDGIQRALSGGPYMDRRFTLDNRPD